MGSRILLTALGVLAMASVGSTEAPLQLRANASVSHAPADLLIMATISPNKDNRSLTVSADSGEYYRASSIQLDGQNHPRTEQVWFKSLPAGDYTVSAALTRADGGRSVASVPVHILGVDR